MTKTNFQGKTFILFSIFANAIMVNQNSRSKKTTLDKVLEYEHASASELRAKYRTEGSNQFRFTPGEIEEFFGQMQVMNFHVKNSLRQMKNIPVGSILKGFQDIVNGENDTIALNTMIQSEY